MNAGRVRPKKAPTARPVPKAPKARTTASIPMQADQVRPPAATPAHPFDADRSGHQSGEKALAAHLGLLATRQLAHHLVLG